MVLFVALLCGTDVMAYELFVEIVRAFEGLACAH